MNSRLSDETNDGMSVRMHNTILVETTPSYCFQEAQKQAMYNKTTLIGLGKLDCDNWTLTHEKHGKGI